MEVQDSLFVNTKSLSKQDRFTTCFKTCGTIPWFFRKVLKSDHSSRVKNGAKLAF